MWRAYWPQKYIEDRILPWEVNDRDSREEFNGFFESHLRKLLLLRNAARYISKNNANVSRIPALVSRFPDGQVQVPFRKPIDHAVSMWRQHQNFIQIHTEEPFARQYMADLGHFDFGANLRPIDFGGWLDNDSVGTPDGVEFWLRYWYAGFESLLSAKLPSQVTFVDYDRLCVEPVAGLRHICEILSVADMDISAQAARFRPSNTYDEFEENLTKNLVAQASAVHSELEQTAIN